MSAPDVPASSSSGGEPQARGAGSGSSSGQTRWRAISAIFHAALELDPTAREAFVHAAAAGDEALATEIRALLAADAQALEYLEEPLVPESPRRLFPAVVHAGDVLCERFRLVRAIAEGGMGQVFEAFDQELRTTVALKVIRPEIAASAEALERFRQEVLLARAIAHPGVCRTFDISHDRRTLDSGEVVDVVFLTMELLAGETLAAYLRREGAVPLGEGLRLAAQIADALAAAHALSIVHRDIKPSNIMLVPVVNSGGEAAASAVGLARVRAVVTDFGLARLDPLRQGEARTALSHSSRPVGTLAYMAPEQLDGAAVSSATDIYAFGLVLYEMATGKRTFPAEDLLSGGLTRRLIGPPPSARQLMPDLPAEWNRAIEWCLQVKPADRPPLIGDALDALAGGRRVPAARKEWRLRIAWPLATAALAVAMALFLVGLRLYQARAQAGVSPGALVYLTPVSNQTADRSLDNLTELIEAGLGQSVQINLLDRNRAGDILQQMTRSPETVLDPPTAREIAMRAGAARVVFATVTGKNGSYRLNIDLEQPDDDPKRFRAQWTRSFAWKSKQSGASIPPELLAAVRDASDWVRHEAGESANDIARLDVPPEDVTTASWQALEEYTQAEQLQGAHRLEDAVVLYRGAIRDDPNFALAYARLGDLLNTLGRTTEGDQTYLVALDRSNVDRLSLREKDMIRGEYAFDTRNYQAAEEAFREEALLYQNDYTAWFRRGLPLIMLGRPREAIEVLERAHAISPKSPGAVGTLARALVAAGDLAGADHWNNLLRSPEFQPSGKEVALYRDGEIRFLRGDLQGALATFATLSKSKAPLYRRAGLRQMADVLAETGERAKAIEVLRDGLDEQPESDRMRLDLAALSCEAGDTAACVREIAQSTERSPETDLLIEASSILGRSLHDARGADAKALNDALTRLASKLPDGSFGELTAIAQCRVRGELMLGEGDVKHALAEFRKADALDPPFVSREYLGRALEAAAEHTPDPASARELRTRAAEAYAVVALNPGLVWSWPLDHPPGFYTYQLGAWLHIAMRLGWSDSRFANAERQYHVYRPGPISLQP